MAWRGTTILYGLRWLRMLLFLLMVRGDDSIVSFSYLLSNPY